MLALSILFDFLVVILIAWAVLWAVAWVLVFAGMAWIRLSDLFHHLTKGKFQ
jgi:hypothetical protein